MVETTHRYTDMNEQFDRMVAQLETLTDALAEGDVCLQECKDGDERSVYVISVASEVDGNRIFNPVARMFTFEEGDNPFEDLSPPEGVEEGTDDTEPSNIISLKPPKIITP